MQHITEFWPPCTRLAASKQETPLQIQHAKGMWLFDEKGHRYFDTLSSWWVNLLGHCHPAINAAIVKQLETLPHVMLANCTHAPARMLAKRLSGLTQERLGHCFFASDGASAVEIALKMSIHHWRNQNQPLKTEFVCLQKSYHGETLGALGVTDVPIFRQAYDVVLQPSHQVQTPDARQAQEHETAADVADRALLDLAKLLTERHQHIAAFIIEPMVQAAAGMVMYDASYLHKAKQLCERFNVLLIADEIAVGCGRTGTFFAFEHAGKEMFPDLLCLSKGISAGYLPLSLVMCTDAVHSAFVDVNRTTDADADANFKVQNNSNRSFLHSHSYTGNALACRAALAMLDVLESEKTLQNNVAQAEFLTQELATALLFFQQTTNMRGVVGALRHLGMIWAFDVDPCICAADFAEKMHLHGRRHELLLRPIGHTVYLMPPYALTFDLSKWLVRQLILTLNEVIQSSKINSNSRT